MAAQSLCIKVERLQVGGANPSPAARFASDLLENSGQEWYRQKGVQESKPHSRWKASPWRAALETPANRSVDIVHSRRWRIDRAKVLPIRGRDLVPSLDADGIRDPQGNDS